MTYPRCEEGIHEMVAETVASHDQCTRCGKWDYELTHEESMRSFAAYLEHMGDTWLKERVFTSLVVWR